MILQIFTDLISVFSMNCIKHFENCFSIDIQIQEKGWSSVKVDVISKACVTQSAKQLAKI